MPVYLLCRKLYRRKLWLVLLSCLTLLIVIPSTLFAFHGLEIVLDIDGPDDVPAQTDLSQMGLDKSHLSDPNPSYQIFWSFDDTTYPGGNSGDGCAFFDSNDSSGFADFAICTSFQTGGSGQVQLTEVTLYDCKNSEPANDEGARCPFTGGGGDGSNGVIAQDANDDGQLDGKNSFCTLNITTNDPFNGIGTHNTSGQQDPLKDTGISCTIFASELKELNGDVPAGIGLSNVCSFTSPDPSSERKDCIVDPGSGFIVVHKVANPNDGTTFAFTLNNQPLTTIQGSGSSSPIPVVGGGTYNLAENVPIGWQLDSATCSNNGNPAALTVPAGQTITCTFTNSLIPNPAYLIGKHYTIADGGPAVNQAGDVINYTITLTNTGNVNLTGVSVSDPLLGGLLSGPATESLTTNGIFEINEVWTYTGSYSVQQSDIDNNGGGDSDIDNTASATTTQLPTAKSASAAVPLVRAPAIAVAKQVVSVKNLNGSVDPLKQVDQAGDLIAYAIVITNTGNQTLHNVTVDDDLTGTVDALCAATLAPGASCTVTVSYTATQADIDTNGGGDGDIDNTATADSDETTPLAASAMVPVAQGPALSIVKSVVSVTNPNNTLDPLKQVDQVGDVVAYTILVTNSGNQTLHNVTVDDDLTGTVDALCAATLAPGASCTVAVSYTASQPDIDTNGGGDGDIDNTATADSTETDPLSTSAMVPVVQSPDLAVAKNVVSVTNPNNTLDPLKQVDQAGDMIVYAIVVTNIGNQTLHNVTVDDDLTNTVDMLCAATLAPGANCTVQVHYTATQTDIDTNGGGDSDIDNTATADSTETDPESASATVPVVQRPSMQIAKTPDLQTVVRGDTATFTITVTNDGNMTLTDVTVSDPNAPICNRLLGTLTVGQVYSYTCQSSTLLNGFTNPATVSANETDPASDSAVVRLADLAISKSPDLQVIQSGATVTFTIRVENTGEVALTTVTIADALAPACNRTFATLAVGEIQEYICTLIGATATFVNTAIADADQTPPVSDTATVQVANLLINKSADPTSLPEPGGLVTFTVDIQNTASTTLTLTTLNDAPYGNITQPGGAIVATTCAVPQRLTPAGNLQGFRYTCSFTVQLTGEPDDYLDTVTATLQDRHGNQIQIVDDATVTITDQLPTVDLAKVVSPASRLEPGGAFLYTLTVTNTSVEAVTIASLSDSQAANADDFSQCATLVGQSLLPNQSVSCQYTVNHTEAGTHPNTATVTVSDNEANTATDAAAASITVNDALPTVILSKTVSPSSRLEPGGPFVFTLTVTNTSVEAVTITALTDSQSALAANFSQCVALIGQTLAANQSVSCQYTVTYTETGAYSNQAAVTVQDNEQNTASSEDSVTVTVNDALPSVTLTKEATPDRLDEPGGAFVFKLTVTNTSVEPVIITALTDSQSGQASNFGQCTALIGQTLAVNQSLSCQYTVNHTDAGSYDNQANVTVRDNENNTATDQSFFTVVVGNTLPSITLTKAAAPSSRTEPGGAFVFTLTVTNTSVEAVMITALIDTQAGQTDFSQCQALIGQSLAIGEVRFCQYTVVHTDAGSYPNEASVTVTDNENNAATGRDVATVTVNDALPLVSLRKTAGPTRLDEPGGSFAFTLTVTNNSVEPVTIAELSDSQQAQIADFAQCTALLGLVLAPGQSRSCQYVVTHTNAGSYENQASVTVFDDEENPATDEAMATVAVNDLLPIIRVSKSAQPGAVLETGGDVLYLIEVYNNGVEPLALTSLVDDRFGDLNGVGNCAVPQTVAPNGGVYRCTFTKTVSGRFGEEHQNIVTATVNDDDGNTTTGDDDATVTFIEVNPNVQVTKEDKLQVDADRDGRVSPGDTLRYILTLVNTGNGPAFNTQLTDTPDPQTKLVVGSVVTSKGLVLVGNGAGDTVVEVEIGDIAPNGAERIQIIFDVVISPQITLPLVRNQAVVTTISGQNEPPEEHPSDDPSTPKIDDETITEVFAPTAEEEIDEPIGSAIRRLFLPLINKR